jgi:hypothetical protein
MVPLHSIKTLFPMARWLGGFIYELECAARPDKKFVF